MALTTIQKDRILALIRQAGVGSQYTPVTPEQAASLKTLLTQNGIDPQEAANYLEQGGYVFEESATTTTGLGGAQQEADKARYSQPGGVGVMPKLVKQGIVNAAGVKHNIIEYQGKFYWVPQSAGSVGAADLSRYPSATSLEAAEVAAAGPGAKTEETPVADRPNATNWMNYDAKTLSALPNEELMPILTAIMAARGPLGLLDFSADRFKTFSAEYINKIVEALYSQPPTFYGDKTATAKALIGDLTNVVQAGGGTIPSTPTTWQTPAATTPPAATPPTTTPPGTTQPAAGTPPPTAGGAIDYTALGRARPDVVDYYKKQGWDTNNLEAIFTNWWGLDRPAGDASKAFGSLGDYANSLKGVTGGTQPAADVTTPADYKPQRTFQELFNIQPGQTPNFGDLSEQEAGYYFDFVNDPASAASNVSRSLGLNPQSGNPFEAFVRNRVPDISQLASDYLTAQGNASASNRNIAQQTTNALASGRTNLLDVGQGKDFLENLYNLSQSYAQGNPLNLEQSSLAYDINSDPTRAFKAYVDSLGAGLSPFLTGNAGLLRNTYQGLREDWRNKAPQNPNQTFLGRLMGR